MANPKAKGTAAKRLNLTVYPKDFYIIEQEKEKALKDDLVFNTSDFFRYCLSRTQYIRDFTENTKKLKDDMINISE